MILPLRLDFLLLVLIRVYTSSLDSRSTSCSQLRLRLPRFAHHTYYVRSRSGSSGLDAFTCLQQLLVVPTITSLLLPVLQFVSFHLPFYSFHIYRLRFAVRSLGNLHLRHFFFFFALFPFLLFYLPLFFYRSILIYLALYGAEGRYITGASGASPACRGDAAPAAQRRVTLTRWLPGIARCGAVLLWAAT